MKFSEHLMWWAGITAAVSLGCFMSWAETNGTRRSEAAFQKQRSAALAVPVVPMPGFVAVTAVHGMKRLFIQQSLIVRFQGDADGSTLYLSDGDFENVLEAADTVAQRIQEARKP